MCHLLGSWQAPSTFQSFRGSSTRFGENAFDWWSLDGRGRGLFVKLARTGSSTNSKIKYKPHATFYLFLFIYLSLYLFVCLPVSHFINVGACYFHLQSWLRAQVLAPRNTYFHFFFKHVTRWHSFPLRWFFSLREASDIFPFVSSRNYDLNAVLKRVGRRKIFICPRWMLLCLKHSYVDKIYEIYTPLQTSITTHPYNISIAALPYKL